MPRHFVEEVAPEIEAPHLGDVLLRRVAGIGIARRAHVERDVELDAALRDVRRVVGIAQAVQRIEADGFGQVESAVHGAGGVAGQHRVRAARGLLLDANRVGLGRAGARRGHAELRGHARGGGARGQDEARRRGIARKSVEGPFGQRGAASRQRAVNLSGGELYGRHGSLATQRSGAGLGTQAGRTQSEESQ